MAAGFLLRRFENPLPINIQQQPDPEQTGDQVRSAVADKRQRQTFVRQKRSGHADVHRGLQSQQRNDAAAEEQSETILGVQRDHDSADDDDDEQKDHEQTDPQTELFADHRKNEIGVRVGQIEHFLAAVAETESFHSAAAPRDQRLHLLQTGIFLEALRIEETRRAVPFVPRFAWQRPKCRANSGER